jgi:Zn-dependent M28 family amino/carboxypeptidase
LQQIQSLSYERATDVDRAHARDYLTQALQELGWAVTPQQFEGGGVNLIAQRPEADPTAGIVLVVAHYDTVPGSPGADDNATGVATLLEVARTFATRRTVRSLQLVLFDQEELGLRGSLAYTAEPANLARLEAVLNLEMLGYACNVAGCQTYPPGLPIQPPSDRGDFLGVIVDQEHASLLNAFQTADDAALPPIVALPVPFKGVLTPDLLRSDHAPFWARNIGAVMVADTANFRNPHYHQPSDLPETLDRRFLTGSAQIVLNAVTRWLDRPTPLIGDF